MHLLAVQPGGFVDDEAFVSSLGQSPADVAPVFEAIMESARRLFGSPMSAIFRYDGELLHLVAQANWPAEAVEDARRLYPGPPNPDMVTGRVLASRKVVDIPDTLADPRYPKATARAGTWPDTGSRRTCCTSAARSARTWSMP